MKGDGGKTSCLTLRARRDLIRAVAIYIVHHVIWPARVGIPGKQHAGKQDVLQHRLNENLVSVRAAVKRVDHRLNRLNSLASPTPATLLKHPLAIGFPGLQQGAAAHNHRPFKPRFVFQS